MEEKGGGGGERLMDRSGPSARLALTVTHVKPAV
jgi:hypothetical protein